MERILIFFDVTISVYKRINFIFKYNCSLITNSDPLYDKSEALDFHIALPTLFKYLMFITHQEMYLFRGFLPLKSKKSFLAI